MFWLCRGGRARRALGWIGCASRERFQAITADIEGD
jgi:hypothetical protein